MNELLKILDRVWTSLARPLKCKIMLKAKNVKINKFITKVKSNDIIIVSV